MQVIFYLVDSPQSGLFGSHEEVGRINFVCVETSDGHTAYRIDFFDTVYFISPENNAQQIIGISQIDVYCISLHTEVSAVQINIIAYIEAVYQTT